MGEWLLTDEELNSGELGKYTQAGIGLLELRRLIAQAQLRKVVEALEKHRDFRLISVNEPLAVNTDVYAALYVLESDWHQLRKEAGLDG